MAEPGDFDARVLTHIAIDQWRESSAYAFPARAQTRKPIREDYAAHAAELIGDLTAALPVIGGAASVPGMTPGALVLVETRTPEEGSRVKAAKIPSALEFPGQDIVILRSSREDDRTEKAILFVPDAARGFLTRRLENYGRDPGNMKRPDLDRFEAVERFRAAEAIALFAQGTDFGGPAVWWELWVREPVARADALAGEARRRNLEAHGDRLLFPDTTIVMVHGVPADIRDLAAATLGAVSEIRRAMGTIRPFLERGDKLVGQADFVAELAGRVMPPPRHAPFVSVLDTGVAAAHPLIAPALAGAHAYDEAWGADDHAGDGGHGTGIAGLVLYGDLEGPMNDLRGVALSHSVVSMKLLPPPGFEPHQPRHYGLITQGAVAQVEIAHGFGTTAYCLATSTEEFSSARPSSWSGALDQIAAGASAGDRGDPLRSAHLAPKRLVVVASGNVTGGMRHELADPGPIDDPAQSWNALTIGGYTAKENVAPEDFPMTPLVGANELSPFSRASSMLPDDLTPLKPEVLFEAGNMLVDRHGFCGWNPSVSLLTAGSDVIVEPLAPMWATSAATGMAGNFLGRLEAALPGLWPETYRALTVQSADWPAPIRKRLIGRGLHWRTSSKAEKQKILRTIGYGVPDLERAVASARNDLTLTAQAELQPFVTNEDNRIVFNEMHFYDLPFPRAVLEALENEVVVMKVTLSYFIEPNLTGKAATRPDTYRSFGLRFEMKKRSESNRRFRARVNAAQENDGERAEQEASHWLLGSKSGAAGSLHCDLWRGRAIELAGHDAIAIYPVGGWWKSHAGQRRGDERARYSLLISLSAPGHTVDMHSEVAARVEARAADIAQAIEAS